MLGGGGRLSFVCKSHETERGEGQAARSRCACVVSLFGGMREFISPNKVASENRNLMPSRNLTDTWTDKTK